jgi:hypothetical protein
MITDRLKESCLDDAKRMISTRFHLWVNDEKFVQYLTIETLFRPSNYFKYVDDIDRIEKTIPKSFTDVDGKSDTVGCWTD